MLRISSCSILAVLVMIGPLTVAAVDEQAPKTPPAKQGITMDQLPAAVKEALTKAAGGGAVSEIEKVSKEGKTFFEAEFVKDGKEVEVLIDESGKVLKVATEDAEEAHELKMEKTDVGQMPAVVKEALKAATGGAAVTGVSKLLVNNKALYVAQYTKDGKETAIIVDEKGQVQKNGIVIMEEGGEDKD